MEKDQWPDGEVRLFPSVHINGQREAELRATASLLAVLRAVSEFGKRVVRIAGGPAGKLSCYTEVSFDLMSDGAKPENVRLDGVLRVQRGKVQWVAYLEAKVGSAALDQDQVDRYHRLAKSMGANALITIGNQSARSDGTPPLNLNRRLARAVPVVHFSWERLLSEAQTFIRRKEVDDEDQKWMLVEWIRYVEDKESRIIEPPDMGSGWSNVLKAAKTNDLAQAHADLVDVANHWVGYLRKLGFQLRARLDADVEVRLSRKEKSDPSLQATNAINLQEGSLSGALRIPGAAGDIGIRILLHSRTVQYVLDVQAPTEGRPATRLRWLARSLNPETTPNDMEISAEWRLPGTRRTFTTACRVAEYLEEPNRLGYDAEGLPVDRLAEPRILRLTWSRSMAGTARRQAGAAVLEHISQGLEKFYHNVVEDVRAFVPRVPKLEEPKVEESKAAEGKPAEPQTMKPMPVPTESAEMDGQPAPTKPTEDAGEQAHPT